MRSDPSKLNVRMYSNEKFRKWNPAIATQRTQSEETSRRTWMLSMGRQLSFYSDAMMSSD